MTGLGRSAPAARGTDTDPKTTSRKAALGEGYNAETISSLSFYSAMPDCAYDLLDALRIKRMNLLLAVRLYWLALAILLIGWSVNLYEELARPTVDWRDAAGIPVLMIISITLASLIQSRNKLSSQPTAFVRVSTTRYTIAGLALVGLICVVLLCFFAMAANSLWVRFDLFAMAFGGFLWCVAFLMRRE
jgi:hypothetical protein